MSNDDFQKLEQDLKSGGAAKSLASLRDILWQRKDYHPWFDATLLQKKHELGLPLSRPTSLEDVPESLRDQFEETYVSAARQAGEAFLKESDIPSAWVYLRTIREPQKVAEAIAKLPAEAVNEEVLNIAFFHGVAPVRGVELMLKTRGTCSTITALDQQFGQMPPASRRDCAAVLVRELYTNLREVLQSEVQKRQPLTQPNQSLRELIAGREWLFEDDNYHVDVSHLNAVVRFARSLNGTDPELEQARQLAEYGSRLSPKYQYGGHPPFDDFYPAHRQYFNALSDQGREEALAWFRGHLGEDPNSSDSQIVAFTLVDLLTRIGRESEALDLAAKYLSNSAEEFGLSLPDLCLKAGRLDILQKLARDKGDLVTFAGALLSAK